MKDGRKKNGVIEQARMLRQNFLGPIVIGPIGDDEFDLVPLFQPIQILPMDRMAHLAAGALDIHDDDGARIDPIDRKAPAGFDQDHISLIEKQGHEGINLFLKKRLPPGDFDQATPIAAHLLEDELNGSIDSLVESIGGIAPVAPQIAKGRSYKNTGKPDIGGFSLNALEDLINFHKCF